MKRLRDREKAKKKMGLRKEFFMILGNNDIWYNPVQISVAFRIWRIRGVMVLLPTFSD